MGSGLAVANAHTRSAPFPHPLLPYQAVQTRPAFIGHARGFDAGEMAVERSNRGLEAGYVVAEGAEQRSIIEAWWRRLERRRAPQAESVLGQPPPWKFDTWVDSAPGRDVTMADDIDRGNPVAVLEVAQQAEQRRDLRFGIGLAAVVVEFDANRG